MKILMAAPFDAKGRYQGGIYSIANSVVQDETALQQNDIEIVQFNTCRKERCNDSIGKFRMTNIKNFYRVYADAVRDVKEARAEVFYYHSSVGLALLKDLMVIRRVKRRTGIKTVLHIHFADFDKIACGNKLLRKMMLRWMKRYVDRIVFLSSRTKDEFVAHGIDEKKCSVIYNFSMLQFEPSEIEQKSSRDRRRLLFVGSVDDRKGIFDLLDVLKEIDKDYLLTVCGGFADGTIEARFRAYEQELGNKMEFLGFVDGELKHRVYAEADALCLPSYGEGLPVVILEAFSAGCSVITTNVGAIPEIVGKENGYLFDPGDREALKRALLAYLDAEPAEILAGAKTNYEYSKRFTLKEFVRELAEACRQA